jgi:hypothetical protein
VSTKFFRRSKVESFFETFDLLKNITFDLLKFDLMIIPYIKDKFLYKIFSDQLMLIPFSVEQFLLHSTVPET